MSMRVSNADAAQVTEIVKTGDNTIKVSWLASPIADLEGRGDDSSEKRKKKDNDLKATVRKIFGTRDIEQYAGVEAGTVERLFRVIKELLLHGYEPRFNGYMRFVHIVNAKGEMRISLQPVLPFKDFGREIPFTLLRGGERIEVAEAAKVLAMKKQNKKDAVKAVTPDPIVVCPECHCQFRVGHKHQ